MKGNENIQKNLITLLKIFKNRPYHLSKYLLDNSAFDNSFLNKIKNSDKLSTLSESNDLNYLTIFQILHKWKTFITLY